MSVNTAAVPRAAYRGVVFDMDGTLTVPTLDFGAIRTEIGLPPGDIAAEILKLPAQGQARAWAIVERHERAAIAAQRLQPGAADLLARCCRAGLRLGLVTRNMLASVESLCGRFGLAFDLVVTRDFAHLKPHPGPVLHMLATWGLTGADVLVVGDYVDDVRCGRAAGAATCFFANPGKTCAGAVPDFTVRSMAELEQIVFPGQAAPCA